MRSLHFCFERSPAGRRCCRNPRAQLGPLFRPMLTQMYVGGVMACTHDHAPPSNRIPPMFPSAAHKCTLSLPMLWEGRSLETLTVSDRAGRLAGNFLNRSLLSLNGGRWQGFVSDQPAAWLVLSDGGRYVPIPRRRNGRSCPPRYPFARAGVGTTDTEPTIRGVVRLSRSGARRVGNIGHSGIVRTLVRLGK